MLGSLSASYQFKVILATCISEWCIHVVPGKCFCLLPCTCSELVLFRYAKVHLSKASVIIFSRLWLLCVSWPSPEVIDLGQGHMQIIINSTLNSQEVLLLLWHFYFDLKSTKPLKHSANFKCWETFLNLIHCTCKINIKHTYT